MLAGRVLVAHNASFDARVLRQAFERCGLDWPAPPVLCTVALARRFAPLVRQRRLALAGGRARHRGRRGAPRAARRAHLRARASARCSRKLCAHAGTRGRGRRSCSRPRRRAAHGGREARAVPAGERPDLSQLPDDPGRLRLPRRARPAALRGQVGVAAHAGAVALLRTRRVDRARRDRGLPADQLGAGRARAREPADQGVAARPATAQLKRTDRWAYLRCRLDIPYPVLEVSAEPAAGHAVNVGPLRGRTPARELADHLTSLFRLRHCGRTMQPPRAPVDLRPDGALLLPVPRRPRPERLPPPDRPRAGALRRPRRRRRTLLLEDLDRRIAEASAARRYEARRRAAAAPRAARRAARAGSAACCARCTPIRGSCSPATRPRARFDALLDRRRAGGGLGRRCRRWTRSAGANRGRAGPLRRDAARRVPAEEVDEVRIVSAWLAEHEPPQLSLAAGAPSADRVARFITNGGGRRATHVRLRVRRRRLISARSRPERRARPPEPRSECVPSQNGLVVDPPQRQSTIDSPSAPTSYSLPSASISRIGPVTL